jgi:hypothetical protein
MGLPEKTPIVEKKEEIGEGGIPEDQPEQSQGFAEAVGPVSLFCVRLTEFSPETEGRRWRGRTRFKPIKTTVHTIGVPHFGERKLAGAVHGGKGLVSAGQDGGEA